VASGPAGFTVTRRGDSTSGRRGLNSEGGLARTIDGRRASVGKIGKVEVTVFDDGEVRVVTRPVTRHRS
jgi:hypothetical protein